jgi:cobalt-zinc-cadmium efflux system outer membrane protein
MEDRADLKSARLSEEQARAETALARAEAKPDLTFSGGYTRQYNEFDGLFAQTVTGSLAPIKDQTDILNFGISLPLRTSRSNQGNVDAASARTSGARLHREYLERTIPLEIEAAYKRWTVATRLLETLQNGVIDPSTANLAVIREAYKSGQLRLLDVLNEQRRLVDAQLAYIDAQADAARSWAEVQRAIGGDLP